MDLVFMLTYNCNLRCTYCDIEKRFDDMTFDTISKAIKFFGENNLNIDTVRFFGGEPLIKKDLIYELINGFKKNSIGNKFYLTTNGIFLDDKFIAFLKDNNFDLNISIDGDSETMVDNRFGEKGNSYHEEIYKNANRCIDFTWINQVITPQKSNKIFTNFLFLYNKGFRKFNFLPEYFCEWSKESLKNLYTGLDQIYKFVSEGNPVFIKNETNNYSSSLFLFGLLLDTNGDLYGTRIVVSAQFEKYKDILKIGNITNGFTVDINSTVWKENYIKLFTDIFNNETQSRVLKSLKFIDKIIYNSLEKIKYKSSILINNNKKTIIKIENPKNFHMVGTGFRVHNYIPGYDIDMSDIKTSPFILLDYNSPWTVEPQGYTSLSSGFHPHRGFETMSLIYEGEIEHKDVNGNGGIIRKDDVEWMTAGSGVIHNEFMSEKFTKKGGVQHMVHLWINLPSKYKMVALKYQNIKSEEIPIWEVYGVKVRVIAGNFLIPRKYGEKLLKKGIANTYSPIEIYDIRFTEKEYLDVKLPEGYITLVLITKGNIILNGEKLVNGDMATLSFTGKEFSILGDVDTNILIMSGEPINEPLIHNKTFVMNTQEEIEQAFQDFEDGKMGIIPI